MFNKKLYVAIYLLSTIGITRLTSLASPEYSYVTPSDSVGIDKCTSSDAMESIQLPEPNRPGFTFIEWNTQPDGTGDSYYAGDFIELSNTTLYAIWQENMSLILDANGGKYQSTEVLEFSFNEDFDPTSNSVSALLEKYDLAAEEIFTDDPPVISDIDIEINDATPSTPEKEISSEALGYYIDPNRIVLPEPSRAGYEFLHYNTRKDDSGECYESGTVAEINGTTLYAIWDKQIGKATASEANKAR